MLKNSISKFTVSDNPLTAPSFRTSRRTIVEAHLETRRVISMFP